MDLGIQFLPFPLPSRDRSTMRTRPQMTSHLGASQGDLAVRADQTMSYYRCNRNCTNSKTYITKKWLYDVIWCYMMLYDVLWCSMLTAFDNRYQLATSLEISTNIDDPTSAHFRLHFSWFITNPRYQNALNLNQIHINSLVQSPFSHGFSLAPIFGLR